MSHLDSLGTQWPTRGRSPEKLNAWRMSSNGYILTVSPLLVVRREHATTGPPVSLSSHVGARLYIVPRTAQVSQKKFFSLPTLCFLKNNFFLRVWPATASDAHALPRQQR
jgi:hypothetical protein